jgi:predicted RNA-binding Zn ribbon-like protein
VAVKDAPGRLKLVQDFLNTVDLEGGTDDLADAPTATRWLRDHDLLGGRERLDEPARHRLVAVREALRDLAGANAGEAVPEASVTVLNRVSTSTPLVVRVRDTAEAAELVPDRKGVDGAIAALLAIVYTAQVDGTWVRFKTCREDVCRWAFYDATKNRSGTWCDMAVCGNRAKARAYRVRNRSS